MGTHGSHSSSHEMALLLTQLGSPGVQPGVPEDLSFTFFIPLIQVLILVTRCSIVTTRTQGNIGVTHSQALRSWSELGQCCVTISRVADKVNVESHPNQNLSCVRCKDEIGLILLLQS